MEEESKCESMGGSMKAFDKMTNRLEKEDLFIAMEMSTKGALRIIKHKEPGLTTTTKDRCMKESGSKILRTDTELRLGRTVRSTKGNF